MAHLRPASLALIAFAALATATACGGNERMMAASGEVPAAQGKVSTEIGENGNRRVHVEVKHLAPPNRVVPAATTYVVWIQVPGVTTQNVGALKVDDDLAGSLEFVTAHKTFRVVITPEADATLATPSNRAVFTAKVDDD